MSDTNNLELLTTCAHYVAALSRCLDLDAIDRDLARRQSGYYNGLGDPLGHDQVSALIVVLDRFRAFANSARMWEATQ